MAVGIDTTALEEALMFIGEVEDTGVIEPVVFPRVVPADELVYSAETDDPILEPAAAV